MQYLPFTCVEKRSEIAEIVIGARDSRVILGEGAQLELGARTVAVQCVLKSIPIFVQGFREGRTFWLDILQTKYQFSRKNLIVWSDHVSPNKQKKQKRKEDEKKANAQQAQQRKEAHNKSQKKSKEVILKSSRASIDTLTTVLSQRKKVGFYGNFKNQTLLLKVWDTNLGVGGPFFPRRSDPGFFLPVRSGSTQIP